MYVCMYVCVNVWGYIQLYHLSFKDSFEFILYADVLECVQTKLFQYFYLTIRSEFTDGRSMEINHNGIYRKPEV